MDCQRARFVLLHHTKKYISYGRSSPMAMPIIFIWDAKLYSIINEKSHLTIIKISTTGILKLLQVFIYVLKTSMARG